MSKALNYLENNIINKSDWLEDNKIKISEIMESYHKDEMLGQSEQYCECKTPKPFIADELYMCCDNCDREVED
jgi:hypothetical protein